MNEIGFSIDDASYLGYLLGILTVVEKHEIDLAFQYIKEKMLFQDFRSHLSKMAAILKFSLNTLQNIGFPNLIIGI
jgi:hypothetical protein